MGLVLGGYLTGGAVGMAVFSDWDVIRLVQSHRQDKALLTDSQSIKNFA